MTLANEEVQRRGAYLPQKSLTSIIFGLVIRGKCSKEQNQFFLTKYYGSLNNPSQADDDIRKQISARDCNNFGETKEVYE